MPVATPKPLTVHTSRTLMFAELAQVMGHALHDQTYLRSLTENVTGKRSRTNQEKTQRYLRQLYRFDLNSPQFLGFQWYWANATEAQRPLLAFLYALSHDFLLAGNVEVVMAASPGVSVSVRAFEEHIEKQHPGRYKSTTRLSAAQNLASSFKQAGYLQGKLSNRRVVLAPDFRHVAFALLLSYLHGDRGEFMLRSPWVRALGLGEQAVRDQIAQAAQRDLLRAQAAGAVLSLSFESFLSNLTRGH